MIGKCTTCRHTVGEERYCSGSSPDLAYYYTRPSVVEVVVAVAMVAAAAGEAGVGAVDARNLSSCAGWSKLRFRKPKLFEQMEAMAPTLPR